MTVDRDRDVMVDFLQAAASTRLRSPAGGDTGKDAQMNYAHHDGCAQANNDGGLPTMSAANLVETIIFEVQVELFEQLKERSPSPTIAMAIAPPSTPSRGTCLLPLESLVDELVQTALR
jgi:hypothetical protein